MRVIDLKYTGNGEQSVLECYVFNPALDEELDDGDCIHCRKYLTIQCEHIDEFIDDSEGDDEE